MKTTKMRSSSFTKITTMTLAMLVIGFASTANAHQWTLVVNGKSMKVDAKIIDVNATKVLLENEKGCLLYTSPSPRDKRQSRMPSSA